MKKVIIYSEHEKKEEISEDVSKVQACKQKGKLGTEFSETQKYCRMKCKPE